MRIITNSPRRASEKPLFDRLKILNLEKSHVYKIGIIMFKVVDNSTPSVFSDLFKHNHAVHDYPTRQSHNFHVPKAKRDYMKRSITVKGVRIWNKLCDFVSHVCMLPTFKFHFRKYLQGINDISHITVTIV